MRNPARIATLSALLFCTISSAQTRQSYQLTVAGTNVTSQAERTAAELVFVDQSGHRTRYQRDVKFDSADGRWLGYSSSVARQAIRWPTNDRGRMMLAALNPRASSTKFQPSRMEIVPASPRVTLPKPGETSRIRMAPETVNAGEWLGSFGGMHLRIRRPVNKDDCVWSLLHVGGDVYRIQCVERGVAKDLAAERRGGKLVVGLVAPTSDGGHLWMVAPSRTTPGTHSIHSLLKDDKLLAFEPGRGIRLLSRTTARGVTDWHIELHQFGPPVSRVVRREVRPGPPLPNGRLELHNNHKRELWVLIVPENDERGAIRQKIPAGENRVLALHRSPETVIVETVEVYSPSGYQREEFVTHLPPRSMYDISVYEVIVQSVSIDRTVPGGKIDDVQYAPKSVGWFDLPPLGERTVINAFDQATAMKNPGAARKLELKNWRKKAETPDPVEDLLKRFKK